MKLTIQNQTASPLSYASGVITVAANGSTTLTTIQQVAALGDGQLKNDCRTGTVYLYDGYVTYGTNDALDYLDKIADNLRILIGATTSTAIGNISDRLKTASTLYDSGGTEQGTSSNPLNTALTLSFAPELLNGRLFSASAELNASNSGSDNPLVLFRNPLTSGKNFFIYKVVVGISIANVAATFKLFSNPTDTNTTSTITNITQPGLNGTATVTTSGANGATIGATFTISGTTNFNGTWTVLGVTSSTVFTFTRTAPLITQTESSGTVVMTSSLGTTMTTNPLKLVTSPTASLALVSSLPTLPSNGSQLIAIAQGQNTTPPLLVDSAQVSLAPGQAILVTANPNSNNRATTVTIIWSEVAP